MTGIPYINAPTRLRGLKWFAGKAGDYFDYDFIIEKRLPDGRHDFEANYPGVRVTVLNAPKIVTVSWTLVLETHSEGIVETDRAAISPEDFKTLIYQRDRILDNIRDCLTEIGAIFSIEYEEVE